MWVCKVYNSENVYPTKQQTGTELFQLVHQASASFARVALYFENSLLPPDLKLLPSASTAVTRIERLGPKTIIESTAGVGLPWKGAAKVDGQAWPAADDQTVWIPAGAHSVEPAAPQSSPRLLRVNGELRAARIVNTTTIEFSYQSTARAIAVLDHAPTKLQIDGADAGMNHAGPATLLLPRGQHVVTVSTE